MPEGANLVELAFEYGEVIILPLLLWLAWQQRQISDLSKREAALSAWKEEHMKADLLMHQQRKRDDERLETEIGLARAETHETMTNILNALLSKEQPKS